MIQKIKNQALAQYNSFDNGSYVIGPFAKNLLEQKSIALGKGFMITDNLIAEAEAFIGRNGCVEHRKDSYCPNCLKAHIIKKAEELGLTEETIEYLNKIMPGEIGHDGYYLDNDELIEA